MNLNLSGKNALVCGSSQGIGKATAQELAELGANVTLVARNQERLQKTLDSLAQNGTQNHQFISIDFSDQASLNKLIREAAEKQPYHILVNNTGGPPGGLVHQADLQEFLTAFNNHLICNQILVQALLPGMKTEGYGRIINIISTSVKQPLDGLGVSNTTRGAVANWAKTLANEVGQWGITVNNVLPGATSTQRLSSIISNKAKKGGLALEEVEAKMKGSVPARRFALPEEIAAAAAFLASPAAAYINGINLPVDGGRTKCL